MNSDDDVTQFKKWNIGQNTWDDISLYSLLIELEQRIPIGEFFWSSFHLRLKITHFNDFRYCHGWISGMESSWI